MPEAEQPLTPAAFDGMAFARTLTSLPGIYRMLAADGTVLYVGKARNLRRRVASYFRSSLLPERIRRLVQRIAAIEVTVTHTESEALLLESTLIKQLQPRFNVLLRDDKGYPYLLLSAGDWPRLSLHRGPRHAPGRYFGPYPNTQAVRDNLVFLQKVFRLRTCEDAVFRHRTRPCLQYQIGRCSAPCVDWIEPARYRQDVDDALRFLEGHSDAVIEERVARMDAAVQAWRFEEAARLRDQIAQLRHLIEHQHVSAQSGELDAVAAQVLGDEACVQVVHVRGGQVVGVVPHLLRVPDGLDAARLLALFLMQFYLDHTPPGEVLLSPEPSRSAIWMSALRERHGRRVLLQMRVRGERAHWLEMARHNAELALASRVSDRAVLGRRFEALREALGLAATPERIEGFDISHTQGESTMASCVVFGSSGFLRREFRRYSIRGVAAGDDPAAMRQAVSRRMARVAEGEGATPDLLLIDGGRAQLAAASEALAELGVSGVLLLAIAKGVERRPGLETLWLEGRDAPLILPEQSPALHLLQQVRDESHRYALSAHRRRREGARTHSVLQDIPGIGPKRRQILLRQFGGLQGLARAGIEDLMAVPGIHRALAELIYATFHADR